MNIKPIETVYNGYRFRSRLEARWAVFFDALGIKYEYEPEGFDLGELGWYLPDFYLPQYNALIEVKSELPNEEAQQKIELCATELDYLPLCMENITYPAMSWIYLADTTDSTGGTQWYCVPWHETQNGNIKFWCDYEVYDVPGSYDFFRENPNRPPPDNILRRSYFRENWSSINNSFPPTSHSIIWDKNTRECLGFHIFDAMLWNSARLKAAIFAARQARFEHGESPVLHTSEGT